MKRPNGSGSVEVAYPSIGPWVQESEGIEVTLRNQAAHAIHEAIPGAEIRAYELRRVASRRHGPVYVWTRRDGNAIVVGMHVRVGDELLDIASAFMMDNHAHVHSWPRLCAAADMLKEAVALRAAHVNEPPPPSPEERGLALADDHRETQRRP